MNCPICNSEMVCKRTIHHYTESGLDNVFLDGVEVCQCSCSEKIVSIPAIPELHSKIGLDMIRKEALLNDREIRFLRKNMGLTKKKLADYIGVDNDAVSQWENNTQPISKPYDRLIRLIYSNMKDIPSEKIKHLIEDDFAKIVSKQKDMPIPVNEWFGC